MNESPRAVRVFVNAQKVDVPSGSSALEAVRLWNAEEASALERGERVITDSRGLPIEAEVRVSAGAIFRLVPVRKRGGPASGVDQGDDFMTPTD
jgi:hypothetical protein